MRISIHTTLLLTMLLLYPIISVAQQTVPQAINYQAIARNSIGSVYVNRTLSVRLTIFTGGASGNQVYKESHSVTTNSFGLFSLKIGTGTPRSVVISLPSTGQKPITG